MSFLNRKYPFQRGGNWIWDCLKYCLIVFLILYLLQPFGLSAYPGPKIPIALSFGVLTFVCCLVFGYLISMPIKKRVRTWRVWHEILSVFTLVLFIGVCNFLLFTKTFNYPLRLDLFLMFIYWTFIIGIFISVLSTILSYQRYLRGQLNALLDKTTDEQTGISVTIHDTRVRGNDVTLPINDLLYIEAQKNNVVVGYLVDGKLKKSELQTSLTAVLSDLGEYDNIFQCHRSFVVNLNNITKAYGNSNGYTMELGGGLATVPVSRSFVGKLKSFIS